MQTTPADQIEDRLIAIDVAIRALIGAHPDRKAIGEGAVESWKTVMQMSELPDGRIDRITNYLGELFRFPR
jgi:hypothetical protein